MKYKIVAVGKIKERYFDLAMEEYKKRISRFGSLEIVEVSECLFNGNPNQKEIEKILLTEAQSILPHLKGFVVLLDIEGKQLSSLSMAEFLSAQKHTNSTITFVVGGSYGLDSSLKTKANFRWSFGEITLPHQLARVVLCEQIYRMCSIEAGSAYHK